MQASLAFCSSAGGQRGRHICAGVAGSELDPCGAGCVSEMGGSMQTAAASRGAKLRECVA